MRQLPSKVQPTDQYTDRYIGRMLIEYGLEYLRRNGTHTDQLEGFIDIFTVDDASYLDVLRMPEPTSPRWVLVTKHCIARSYHPEPAKHIHFRGQMEINEGILTFKRGYGEDTLLTAVSSALGEFEDSDCFTIHENPKGLTPSWTLETKTYKISSKPQRYDEPKP